jgi:Tol biopolymer transport system component
MTLTAFAQQPLTPTPTSAKSALIGDPGASPQATTDPTKLESKNVADMSAFSIEKLYTTRLIGESTWSPDGKQVAFISNISGRNNLWLVPVAGGWPTQLTISDQRQSEPVWSPDGTWIAYISDHDGDEQWDVFMVSPKTGDIVNLTTSTESAEMSPAWAPDGHSIVYATKLKTGSSYEIELMDIATRHITHVTTKTAKELSNDGPIFSHDGKFIVYTQSHATGKDSNIFVYEVASGQSTNLTPHEGRVEEDQLAHE